MTTCTSGATRKRAPPRLRLIWSCLTIWIATIFSRTSSSAFPSSALTPAYAQAVSSRDKLIEHGTISLTHGDDLPEVRDWTWSRRIEEHAPWRRTAFAFSTVTCTVMEPPDLWQRYIDSQYRARAPRGVISANVRDLRMVIRTARNRARATTRQNNSARGHNFERNQELYRSAAERGWSAAVQLEAMDIEGIDRAVLYPTRGLRALVVHDMDAGFAAAMARAYNDWLYDFCSKEPARLNRRRHDLALQYGGRGQRSAALRPGVGLPRHFPALEPAGRAPVGTTPTTNLYGML